MPTLRLSPIVLALVILIVLSFRALPGAAGSKPVDGAPLGAVERVQGEARLVRATQSSAVEAGQPVVRGDALSTSVGARLLLVFKDGTKLMLGESAEAFIDEFVYNPIKKSGAAFIDILKGAFRYTSGGMREFNDKRIEVRTSVATLAVRGTDFWSGPIDDGWGIVVLSGRIEVRNDAGVVVLDRKRLGSMIAAPGKAPEMPVAWGKEKVTRAFATVSFR